MGTDRCGASGGAPPSSIERAEKGTLRQREGHEIKRINPNERQYSVYFPRKWEHTTIYSPMQCV